MSVREQLAGRLGIDEDVPTADAKAAELRERLQRLAPGVRAGDPEARAEFDRLEAEIADEARRRRVDELADQEEAEQEAEAERQRVEAQRAQWQAEGEQLESDLAIALGKVERAIAGLVDDIKRALDVDADLWQVRRLLDPDSLAHSRVHRMIEQRAQARLESIGIRPDGIVRGGAGSEPLGAPDCSVCKHPERAAIDEARAAGEPLSALAERFGISKSTLSRHGSH